MPKIYDERILPDYFALYSRYLNNAYFVAFYCLNQMSIVLLHILIPIM